MKGNISEASLLKIDTSGSTSVNKEKQFEEFLKEKSSGKLSYLTGRKRATTSMGRFSLITETDTNLSIGCGFLTLNSAMSHEMFEYLILEKVVKPFYRFHSKINYPNFDHFVEDTTFDIKNHLFLMKILPQGKALSDQEKTQILQSKISELMNRPFDLNHPLWRMYHFPEFATCFWMTHHSIGDGASTSSIMASLCDSSPFEAIEKIIQLEIDKFNSKVWYQRWSLLCAYYLYTIYFYTIGMLRLAWKWVLLTLFGQQNCHIFLKSKSVSTKKRVAWLSNLSVSRLKQIGTTVKGKATLNDVCLSIIAGGLHRYRKLYDPSYSKYPNVTVRCSIPVDIRNTFIIKEPGNVFGQLLCDLPLNEESSFKRLHQVKKSMDYSKSLPEPKVSYYIVKIVMDYLSWLLSKKFVQSSFGYLTSNYISFVCTNVRAGDSPLSIQQKVIQTFCGFVPPPPNIPLGFCIMSYNNNLSLSVNSDQNVIANPQELIHCIEEEYQELVRAL